jgi:GT2 family glycosyltransferase
MGTGTPSHTVSGMRPAEDTSATVPATVVIPTIGRPDLLRRCLESVVACRPRAEDVVIVDQSEGDADAVAAEFTDAGVRVVPSSGRGIGLATNEGIAGARCATVLVTHDDCTVAPDWVGVAYQLVLEDPDQIVTGRVTPDGPADSVPSIRDSPDPIDFGRESYPWVLCPHNMAFSRERMLEFGGFDERFILAAEDVDLAYRWLKDGRALRYRPQMVVVHHAWRGPERLRRTYVVYHRGRGQFYGKHLRHGDLRMLRYLALDAYWTLRSIPERVRSRKTAHVHNRYGVWRGLPAGLARGLRMSHSDGRRAT